MDNKAHIASIVKEMSVRNKVDLLSGLGLWRTASLPEFGIESIVMTDGTYGVRYNSSQIDSTRSLSIADFAAVVNQKSSKQDDDGQTGGIEALLGSSRPATCFPNGSSLACSWDIDLAFRMGQALAAECHEFGVGILLGPGINLRRTPLGGRGYEYYSEDPVVSGEFAAALINGLQAEGIGASLKHFACNNSEYRRTQTNSVVDERSLHELYLSAFKRAIRKSNPWTIMSSYNLLNGIDASQNFELLTEILRNQWHYDGVVMSDWYAIKDRPASLRAGNDLSMPETRTDKRTLLKAIEAGTVSMDQVDQSCIRLMELVQKVSVGRSRKTHADFMAHHRLAQEIAQDSVVLLRNEDDILPLSSGRHRRVAIIGNPAHEPVIQGSGCATTVPYFLDRPLDEILDVAGDDFDISFAIGASSEAVLNEAELREAVAVAQDADVAVIFVSTVVGQDGENGDRADLNIAPSHEALLRAVADVQHNVVVVLANCDAVVMPWLHHCKGLLETFFSGQGVGRAVARILFGYANPSG